MNIFFSGIGGVGIGPLAEIAHDAGYQVTGSDLSESLQVQKLRERGISVGMEQDGSFLEAQHAAAPIDWLVYTSAIPADHPELLRAEALGIKISKRDELLAHIIKEKNLKLVAVAGTHGKTTTTGMLVWTLLKLGIPVSYSIGSTLSFGPNGKFDPQSKYFIYECDEYDRNFLHFSPYLSLVTAIGYDHPDIYPTEEDYNQAFRQFLDQSDMRIMWQRDSQLISALLEGWQLQENEMMPLHIPGEHNRRNATIVAKAVEYLFPDRHADIAPILEAFPGTDRRFERLADNLYSDYAHHPVEIAATLELASELSQHVVAVYQPHQNRRQYEVRDQYEHCFDRAEQVFWLPTYLSREDPTQEVLRPNELFANAATKDRFKAAEMDDELWQAIAKARAEGKIVLAMGAGTIDGWLRTQLKKTAQ